MNIFKGKTKAYLSSVRERYLTTEEAQSPEFEETIPSTLSATKGKIKLLFYVANSLSYGSPRPIVFNIHGGGYTHGSPQDNAKWTSKLVAEGYVAVSVGYRLMPKHDRVTAVNDCVDSVLWVYRNAERLNLDKRSIGISGFEVGGQIALEVALMLQGLDQGQNVVIKAIVALEPSFEFDFSRDLPARKGENGSQGEAAVDAKPDTIKSQSPTITILTTLLYPKDEELELLRRRYNALGGSMFYRTTPTQGTAAEESTKGQKDVQNLVLEEGVQILNKELYSTEAAKRAQHLNIGSLTSNDNYLMLSVPG